MKPATSWKSVILLSAVLFANAALAVTPDEEEEKDCKKPKFRDFSPPAKSEVAPESDIAFHISHNADPNHVTATAKGEKVAIKVVDKNTFYLVNGKLPASLRDGFARIHVTAKAADGECIGQDGWLIKFKGEQTAAATAGESSNKAPAAASQP